jgi:hypothetical protein
MAEGDTQDVRKPTAMNLFDSLVAGGANGVGDETRQLPKCQSVNSCWGWFFCELQVCRSIGNTIVKKKNCN